MALHVNVESNTELHINPLHTDEDTIVPHHRLPDTAMAADTALQIVLDELMFDGRARLNLATFCTSWFEPQARQLSTECIDRNLIDRDEYPQTAELERRCLAMLADLWHDPATSVTGCSTSGSSEAAMLAGLAMKWRWQARRSAEGKPASRPNLILGANAHVCWLKFCRYWDVEPVVVPITRESLDLAPDQVRARCDENTIGVVAVLGSTEHGRYDPVAGIATALDEVQRTESWDIPLHVDAASGGFVAPFLQPDLVWDFRLDRVRSINTSAHKYGLVPPALGWVLWRTPEDLPSDLVFEVGYLGGQIRTFELSFSRSGAPIAMQYYNFVRFGFEGYRRVMRTCQDVARHVAAGLLRTGKFVLLSQDDTLPVVAARLADDITAYTVFDVCDRLRARGWQVPAYTLPPDLHTTSIMRVVIRNGFSRDLASMFLADLRSVLESLAQPPSRTELELIAG